MSAVRFDLERHEAPPYSIDSPHLLSGYRSQMSLGRCAASAFYWHNETLNIWSSALLVLLNLGLTAHIICAQSESIWTATAIPTSALLLHGGLRALCWLGSLLYHTFAPHSRRTAELLCRMDYLGCFLTPLGVGTNLLILELGDAAPRICLVLLGLGAGIIALAVVAALLPRYQSEAFRSWRALLSLLAALPYLLGLAIAVQVTHGGRVPEHYWVHLGSGAAWMLGAAFFYVTCLPERWIPRHFDRGTSSHALWHLLNIGFDVHMLLFAQSSLALLRRRSIFAA